MRRALLVLEAYHSSNFDASEPRLHAFRSISEAIDEAIGVVIPHERLRQFAKGAPAPGAAHTRKYPKRLKPAERMIALEAFLRTDEVTNAILGDLRVGDTHSAAPVVLLEFLNRPAGIEGESTIYIEGRYEHKFLDLNRSEHYELTLSVQKGGGDI